MITINTSECFEMSTISKFQNSFYYYILKINNEMQIQELLKELINIIQQTNSQNCHLIMQTLYYILQRSNIIIKYNYNPNQVYTLSDIISSNLSNFNYLFILNKQIMFQFNYRTLEDLLKNENKLQYITYKLNLNQNIPNQAIFISYNKYEILLLKSKLNRNEETRKICDGSVIIQNDNLFKSNNPFKLLNNKRNANVNKRTLSIKNNRKINETILRKKESIHNITNNDSFITKKKEGNKGKTLKYLNKKNLNIKGLKVKRGSIHGNLKKLNNEFISKYYFYQEGMGQFKILVNHSCLFMENHMNLDGLSDKEKVKMFFKGKYFKNLYQKINVFQNNLRDYVNNENHEIKHDQNTLSSKLLTIGLKNSKSFNNLQMDYPSLNKINTLNLSLSQSNLSEKNTVRNITLKSNKITKTTSKSDNNDSNDNNINNYLYSKSSSRTDNTLNLSDTNLLNTKYLSLDANASTTQITTINVENLPNNKYSTEFNQSIKSLKDTTDNQNTKENLKENLKENPKENHHNTGNSFSNKQTSNIDKEAIDFKDNNNDLKSKFNQNFSSQNNLIEKTNIISSNEIVTPSITSNSNSEINNISSEQVNLTSSANSSKRNRRSKHNRSSAVCLSSNDIKGILEQTKKNEVPSNSNSMSSYAMERSLNDSTKYHRGYITTNPTISKDSIERRKLLSRDYYHPTLSTLSSTPFCYSDYYPTIRLPLMPRSSSFYSTRQQTQQPWINPSKLNA